MATNRSGASLHGLYDLFHAGTFAGLSDRDLLDRFQRRDDAASQGAFAALVGRHGALVWRTCRSVLNDAHDAEDAFQVTFLVLARKAGSIRRRDSVAGWLHGVACRTAACARGSAARRRRHERAATAGAREAVRGPEPDDLSPVLHEEIDRLSGRLRAAILLCEFEGLTCEQAAAQLGCPVGTVKSRLARARERLRRRLTRRGLGPVVGLPGVVRGAVPPALLESTVAAVSRQTGGRAGVLLSAAAVAWQAGVLRAMLMTRIKTAAVLLSIGAVAAGTTMLALGQAVNTAKAPAKAADSPRAELSPEQLLAVLARARIDAAGQVLDDRLTLYKGGEIPVTKYLEARRLYNDAVLAATQDRSDRLVLLRGQLKVAAALENETKERYRRNEATRADLKLVEYDRLDAAIQLAEAETGRKADLRTPLTPEQRDPAKGEAVYERFAREQATNSLRALMAKTVTVGYPNPTPLAAVLKGLKAAGAGPGDDGPPIFVDPEGLTRARVTTETKVVVPRTTCTLADAFLRVLRPLGLAYKVEDGLVRITSP